MVHVAEVNKQMYTSSLLYWNYEYINRIIIIFVRGSSEEILQLVSWFIVTIINNNVSGYKTV